jgi:heptosyltransferase-2
MNKKFDIKNFRRIAIIQTAFLGDIALALYFAETIQELHPDCEIIFVSNPIAVELLKSSKNIDIVISFDKRGSDSGIKGIRDLSDKLKKLETECIFGLQRSMRTSLITYLAKPKLSVGFENSTFSILYKKRAKYILGIHETQRNNKLLLDLVHDDEGKSLIEKHRWGVDLEINNDIKEKIDSKLNILGVKNTDKLIAIAPGSVWETKRWIEDYYTELIIKLINQGLNPILIGAKNEVSLSEKIRKATHCLSLVGETSIMELLELLNRVKLTITNDSAPTHLAGLVRCKTITIFGSTVPEFGFGPLGPFDIAVGNNNLKCRPCGIHGSRKCPIKSFDCMKTITTDMVYQSVLKILEID